MGENNNGQPKAEGGIISARGDNVMDVLYAFPNDPKTRALNEPGVKITTEKEMKQAFKDFAKHAEIMDEPYRDIYLYYAKNTKLTGDKLRMFYLGYDPDKDVLVYNKDYLKVPRYQAEGNMAFSHELAHRYDMLVYKSWENDAFTAAVKKAEDTIKSDIAKHESMYEQSLNMNRAYQDVLDALSRGGIRTTAGHDKNYWNSKTVSLEIFANLSYLRANKISIPEFDGLLDELITLTEKAFERGVV